MAEPTETETGTETATESESETGTGTESESETGTGTESGTETGTNEADRVNAAELIASAAQAAHDAADAPEPERPDAYRTVLRTHIHDVVRRLSVNYDRPPEGVLEGFADLVRTAVPEDAEQPMHPRGRVFVQLLRHGALEPAWVLAHDNASGVVKPDKQKSMWAGGSYLNHELPLPTLIEGQHVYAWLPGFRDPRYDLPDALFALDDDTYLRGVLDEATIERGTLHLRGSVYLRLLEADEADVVTLTFDGPDGAHHETRATRVRRTDLVKDKGPELTRLAWAGWHAAVDLSPLRGAPGTWRPRIRLAHRGLVRDEPLGWRRGPLARPELLDEAHEWRGYWFRLAAASDERLMLRVGRLGAAARLIPPGARSALRAVRG